LQGLLTDFTGLQDQLQDAISTTSDRSAEAAAAQAKDLSNVRDLARAATRALEDMQADTVAHDMNTLIFRLRAEFDDIATSLSVQLANAKRHLDLSEELLAAQQSHLESQERMQDSAKSLASELDGANRIAGVMSTRLENVNQALTRVEAASTILSSLFAIITIPCQLAEHLHLKLLALFATPAFVILFWKPWRHSCSLMAIYGMSPAYFPTCSH
jgi:paraquat-inducible protein B